MIHQRTTRLFLIRHAESVANAERRMQGWGDDPLSSRGEDQASRLAEWLRANNPQPHVLFASTLRRAYQTAVAVGDALRLPVQLRPGLREIGLGQLEDVDESFLLTALSVDNFEAVYQVETLVNFAERGIGTLAGLLATHDGKTLMVVAHGGIIGVALSYWLDRDIARTWSSYGNTHNTAITELVFGEGVELIRYNDTPHLE
jgi:broad specificity phosphatase PhoE